MIQWIVQTGDTTVKACAEAFGIAPHTIEAHRTNIFAKLKVHNVLSMVIALLKREIIKLDDIPDPSPGINVAVKVD